MQAKTILGVVVLGLLLAVSTACEPAPPRVAMRAVPDATGPDARPGDGTCATDEGRCSLQAAIDEANSQPRAHVDVADGVYPATTLIVTGDVEIVGESTSGDLSSSEVRVAEGAVLRLRALSLGSLEVDGIVIADRVGFGFPDTDGPHPANVAVGPTGRAVLSDVHLVAWLQDGVRNEGQLTLRYATLWSGNASNGIDGVITTTGAGRTNLGAVVFLGSPDGDMDPACVGTPPESAGWNLSYDRTCGLTGPGDIEGVSETDFDAEDGSPRIDAVPIGELACAEEPSGIFLGHRALDDDGDGIVACDIGYGFG